jgi:acyl-CoA thioester hydrolase
MMPPHRHNLRIYYDDTDAGGVVYHANYLKFAERARTEMMRAAGLDHRTLLEEDGVVFAVRRCHVEYLAPAMLDDLLEVESQVTEITGATLEVEQIVRRERRDLARLNITLVCLTRDGRATRWPPRLRSLFRTGTADSNEPHTVEARE